MAKAKHSFTPAENEGLTRRHLLRAAPAVGFAALVAGAVPVEAASECESEIIRLYRKHVAITDEAAAHPSIDDRELDELFYNRRDEIEDRMMALPCRTPGEFAAKVIVASCRGETFPDWNRGAIWAEARALVGT